MSYFARVDKDNIVQSVHVVDDSYLLNEHGDEEEVFGIAFLNKMHGTGFTWVQTSDTIRKNFAGVGMTYDKDKDAFIPPKTCASMVLNESTCKYEPPTSMPDDGKMYVWIEETTSWEEFPA